MNKLIIIILFVFTGLSYSQDIKESEVPDLVKNKFYSVYPGMNNVKWEMENNNYEAEFKESSIEKSVIISRTGTIIATETEITVSSLPVDVVNSINKDYPGSKIKEATKVETSSGILYEAEVELGNRSWDILYSADGKQIEKESGDDKDDDKKYK